MIQYLGSMALGALSFGTEIAITQLSVAMGPVMAQQAALIAQIAANIQQQTSLADVAALAAQVAASIAALPSTLSAIVSDLIPNLISVNAQYGLDLASLSAITLGIATLIGELGAALATGGLHAYSLDTTAGAMGSEITASTGSGLPGGGGSGAGVKALLICTESPAAWAALSAVLKTS